MIEELKMWIGWSLRPNTFVIPVDMDGWQDGIVFLRSGNTCRFIGYLLHMSMR